MVLQTMNSEMPQKVDPNLPEHSILRNMLRGAGWGVLMRWCLRFIGVFNLMIIARLLTPTELGVVGFATLLSGFLTQFYLMGFAMHLIRKQSIDRADCDSAWSIRMLMGGVIAIAMVALSESVAGYFDEPRMVGLTYVIALSFFVSSCANIGLVLARRELNFALDFRFNIYVRLANFFATIVLAIWLRNAWAIVLASLAGAIIEVILSFKMHSYRPRFSLSLYKEYLVFGLTVIPINVGQYLLKKVDSWIVGGFAATDRFVAYNVGSDLSAIFTQQVVGTIGRGQLPNYSRILHQPEKLATAFTHEVNTVCTFMLPVIAWLVLDAADAVAILLGDQWGHVVPLLPWLAISSAVSSIATLITGAILIATGYERLSAVMIWIRLGILVPIAYLASLSNSVETVAMAVVLASFISMPLAIGALTWSRVVSLAQLASAIWRPCISVLIMAAAIALVQQVTVFEFAITRLVRDVLTGGLVYSVCLLLLWRFAGRPEGPESVIVKFLMEIPSKKLRKV